MKKYTQSEARRLAKQVDGLISILNQQKNNWTSEWPEGIKITEMPIGDQRMLGAIETARKLGHAVVVTVYGQMLMFHACELPRV